MKKYSFIIPCYNIKKLLKNTLCSIASLKTSNEYDFEVIIVDDGSDDGTRDMVSNIDSNFELKYIFEERNSLSCRARARNTGIKHAKGQIAVFIDGDILVPPNYLFEIDRCFRINADIALFGLRTMLPKGIEINLERIFNEFKFDQRKAKQIELRNHVFDRLSYNMSALKWPGLLFCTCNAAVPLKYLHLAGGFDEKFKGWGIEDNELGYRLQCIKELKILLNSKMDVLHQYHEREKTIFNDYKRNINYFISKIPETFDSIPMKDAYDINDAIYKDPKSFIRRYSVMDNSNSRKVEMVFDNKKDLSSFKKEILSLSSMNGVELVVNDIVEDTDIDIWIQLLGTKNSTPLYFPVSKKFKRGSYPCENL